MSTARTSMSDFSESEQMRYQNDPMFHAWATSVEQVLTTGGMDMESILAATKVGMTHYAMHHALPCIITVEYLLKSGSVDVVIRLQPE